jgi:hypothetical protein
MEWSTTAAKQWYSGVSPGPAETRYEILMICSQVSHTISFYYLICSMYDLICSMYDIAKKTCYVVWYIMDLGAPRRVSDYDIIVKTAIYDTISHTM